MNTAKETDRYADLDGFIAGLGLTFEATPVPARTDGDATDWGKDAFHFVVTLGKGSAQLSTNYSMGSGHKVLVPYDTLLKNPSLFYSETLGHRGTPKDYDEISAPGFRPRYVWQKELQAKMYRAPTPALRDVLYSLIMDADAINCATFEEWADNYGYDKDIRKAEKIYRTCLEHGLKLRTMIGDANLAKLRELFADY